MPGTLLTNPSRLPSRSQAALTLGAAALLMAGLPACAIDARPRPVPVAVSIVDRDIGALLDVYAKDGRSFVGGKKLLADAGYPPGFEVAMYCPNDCYVNDIAAPMFCARRLRAAQTADAVWVISANLIFMPSRHRIGTFEGVVLRIGVWLWRPSFACNCAATRRGCRRGLLACA